MNDNISQFLRIVPSQRLDDRFLTALHITPEDDLKKSMGDICIVVEITRPWFPVSQIGSRIITTFKKAYYAGDSSSDLVNFEGAVKKVNEVLLSLTEQGETEWIGHLNAVIGVIINKDIHLTSAGLAQALLFRDGKVSYITEKKTNNQPHPLKTFGSIISGTLLTDDAILMTTPDLMNTADLTTLKGYFEELSAFRVGSQLLKYIRRSKIKTVGTIIIKLTTKSLSTVSDPEVLYTDQVFKDKTLALRQYWQDQILPLFHIGVAKSIELSQKAHQQTKTKIIPTSKVVATTIIQKTNSGLTSAWLKTKPMVNKQSQKIASSFDSALTGIKDKRDTTHFEDDSAESIIGKSIFTINDYQDEIAKNESKKSKVKNFKGQIKRTYLFLWLKTLKMSKRFKGKKNKPLLLTIGGILLVILLITSIAIQRHYKDNQTATDKQQSALDKANNKLNSGKTALTKNQNQTAQADFYQAITLAKPLVNSPLSSRAKTILESAQNESDKLTNTTRIDKPKQITEINGSNFQIASNNGYSINSKGEIYETGLINNAVSSQVAKLPSHDNTVTATTVTDDDNLIINTKNKNLYELNSQTNKLTKFNSASHDLISSTAISFFGNTIYMLDPANNQIWKYGISGDNLDSRTEYIPNSKIDLANATGLAIDGSIYVLYKDGRVKQLVKGVDQNFSLASLPLASDNIDDAISLYTNEETNSIYTLDKGQSRVIEYNKTGQFVHQYILNNQLKDIKSFVIQPKGLTGYIVNKSQVYRINL